MGPMRLCARIQRDGVPSPQRVWQAHIQGYGAGKVWRPLNGEDTVVARCTVERLMRL